VDWWENPTIDLVPQLKRNKDLVLTVKDRTGEIGCLRFNHLFPPFDNAAIRRVVLAAMDQKEVMTAVAGAEPSLIKTDVGLFVPGTPMASTVGVEITRGPKDLDKIKKETWPVQVTKASASSCSPLRQFRRSSPRRRSPLMCCSASA
jgi:peptide/nickel transport system substrate-binding protein